MTKTEFNNTPIVIGARPTTYGELRQHAQGTIESTNPEVVALSTALNPNLTPEAIKGLCRVTLALLDEIERLTPIEEE